MQLDNRQLPLQLAGLPLKSEYWHHFITHVSDYITAISVGEAKSFDICDYYNAGALGSTTSTPSSASTPTPLGRYPQAFHPRAVKNMTPIDVRENQLKGSEHVEPQQLYRFFVEAVLSLTSYGLAASRAAIPLGYRDFLFILDEESDLSELLSNAEETPFPIYSINAQLTPRGHLIISSVHGRSGWKQIKCDFDDTGHLKHGLVRIAPSGVLAKVLCSENTKDKAEKQSVPNRITDRSRTAHSALSAWKINVLRFLHNYGLDFSQVAQQLLWLWIRISKKADNGDLPEFKARYVEVLWPAQLCFHVDEDILSGSSLAFSSRTCLSDIHVAHNLKTQDPLQIAEEILLHKLPAEPPVPEVNTPDARSEGPLSPVCSRLNLAPDHQAVSGIYPTPPDYVSGPSTTTNELTSVSINPNNTNTYSKITSPAQNTGSFDVDEDSGDMKDEHVEENNFTNINTEDDGLFRSMDSEENGPSGVTEADFNFFDEPNEEIERFWNDHEAEDDTAQLDFDDVGKESERSLVDGQEKAFAQEQEQENDVKAADYRGKDTEEGRADVQFGDVSKLQDSALSTETDDKDLKKTGINAAKQIDKDIPYESILNPSLLIENKDTLRSEPDLRSFDAIIKKIDEKYDKNGRFAFTLKKDEDPIDKPDKSENHISNNDFVPDIALPRKPKTLRRSREIVAGESKHVHQRPTYREESSSSDDDDETDYESSNTSDNVAILSEVNENPGMGSSTEAGQNMLARKRQCLNLSNVLGSEFVGKVSSYSNADQNDEVSIGPTNIYLYHCQKYDRCIYVPNTMFSV